MRAAFYGQYATAQVWLGVGVATVLAAGCLVLGARAFARLSV
jgi:hypothetical protein